MPQANSRLDGTKLRESLNRHVQSLSVGIWRLSNWDHPIPFSAIRNELQELPDRDSLAQDYENVLERNKELEEQGVLQQWTIEKTNESLQSAGFTVIEEDDAYVGQAMILIAQRDD